VVAGHDGRVQVDIGFDPALLPPVPTEVGATRDPRDLAGDKLLALFGRAAARDVLGVAQLVDSPARQSQPERRKARYMNVHTPPISNSTAG
jgi:hypothetical protein